VARAAIVVSLALLLSGCSMQDVNDYSLFKYRYSDDAGEMALKTMGNIVPWTVEAAVVGTVAGTVAAVAGGLILGYLYLLSLSNQSSDLPNRSSIP
jgi:outer membrane lipoprotein SlyB